MFPGGRSSQNAPGGNSTFPSTYYRDVAAVSNPAWFGNNPTPVPPPVQYPPRAESGRDLLAESYERMRNEMRSLQGSSTTKHDSRLSAPPPPTIEEKNNPLTQLLENKDVSLSSLLEAAMDPNIGSSKRKEDPIMKKAILDKCEGKIAQLYRLRISGQGMFFPMTQPKTVKYDGFSTSTFNHPRIEFNMVLEDTVWTCPEVVVEMPKEEAPEEKNEPSEMKKASLELDSQKELPKDQILSNPQSKIDTLLSQGPQPPPVVQPESGLHMVTKPPPSMANVSYPSLSQYRSIVAPSIAVGPCTHPPPALPNVGLSSMLPSEVLAEMEKERRRREIEMEWDRLMEDKERKDKKRKKKKRRSRSGSSSSGGFNSRRSKSRRSTSRGRSRRKSHSRDRSHRRSHSRNRSRNWSRDRRHRRRSRSLSLSMSPPHKHVLSELRMRLRRSRSRSPRTRLPPLQPLLAHSPPRYQRSPPREHFPPIGPPPLPHYTDGPPGVPPVYDNYYNYGPGNYNHPPPGINYAPQYPPGMPPYGPMGPGPGSLMDLNYFPPRGPWMGPGPGPQWFGSHPIRPRGPPIRRPPKPLPSIVPTKTSKNLIDLTSKARTVDAKPVAVVDITDDNEKPSVDSKDKIAEPDSKLVADKPNQQLEAERFVDKAKVISNIIPPGVSPERETQSKYPNVESEFTRPMRAKFRKMLEPLDKVLDKIRLYQRDSFDYKTLIKNLEHGKIEFMGVHTLHDGLLCKLEINRNQPDKFFKIVVPFTHTGRLLRVIHSTYHDYSIGRIQRLVDDLFCDPHDFPLSKIISVTKQCKLCIKTEENEREALRKKEVLVLQSPGADKAEEPLDGEKKSVKNPSVKVRRDRHGNRILHQRVGKERKRSKDGPSGRSSDTEKDGKPRRDSEKDQVESKGERTKKVEEKISENAIVDPYSKFEDLSVGRKKDGPLISPEQKKKVLKKGVRVHKVDGKGISASENGEKEKSEAAPVEQRLPAVVAQNVPAQTITSKPTSTTDSKSLPKQQKSVVNPDDFKERVRTVQMAVDDLGSAISDLEGLGKKAADPTLLLKAGMLCRRLPVPKGQGKPEVKIVVTPPCLDKMVEIVHTMSAIHAPFQKTVTVFKKHFVPIDGLEEVVSEVLNNCANCASN